VTREQRAHQLEHEARAFHHAHPDVWKHFVRIAIDSLKAGEKRGQRWVWERVRWETNSGGGTYKLNDHHTASYARWFNNRVKPAHFELRTNAPEPVQAEPTQEVLPL